MFDPLTLVDPGLVDRMYGGAAVRCLELKLAPVEPDFGDLPWRQAGVDDLLSAYADRRVSPSDILTELTGVIQSSGAGTEAVLRLVAGAQSAARDSDERWRSGTARPLEGIPFGVKDIIDVEGTVVTSGSHFTGERVAPVDADVVAASSRCRCHPLCHDGDHRVCDGFATQSTLRHSDQSVG